MLRATRGRLARRIDRRAPPGPVLDVGAGDGALLDALHRRGRPALGLERSSDRADMRTGPIEDAGGPWAAVVAWHTLEHLAEPDRSLEAAARALAPQGVLFVAMPNGASLQARVFGERWFALDLPRHLVHLPACLLISRLGGLGLKVERVSFWRGGQVTFGWLHGLVGLLPGHPDLYDAIRRPSARANALDRRRLATVCLVAIMLAPTALLAAVLEIALGRAGSVYVEARSGG